MEVRTGGRELFFFSFDDTELTFWHTSPSVLCFMFRISGVTYS